MAEKRALVGNASSEKQVRNAEAVERLRDEQDTRDIAELVNSDVGIRFLARRLTEWNAFGPTYSEKPVRMAYLAGRRDCALQVLSMIDGVDGGMARLMVEHAKQQNAGKPREKSEESEADE